MMPVVVMSLLLICSSAGALLAAWGVLALLFLFLSPAPPSVDTPAASSSVDSLGWSSSETAHGRAGG
jgi:hypothetical protein